MTFMRVPEPTLSEIQQVAAGLAIGAYSPVDLTNQLLERIHQLDAGESGFTYIADEHALKSATKAAKEIASGRYRGELHGIPIAVKDNISVEGMPTGVGFSPHYPPIQLAGSSIARRLEDAGAIILGKLALPEGAYTEHLKSTVTPINPWGKSLWSGTSSSGNGVAVTRGLCFGAIGTDTGGSIRFPSSIAGVTGLKPTYGRISRKGVFPLSPSLDHVGPMARSAYDAGILYRAIAGPDPADTTTHYPMLDGYRGRTRGRSLRVGVDRGWSLSDVDPSVADAFMSTLNTLVTGGGRETAIAFPSVGQVLRDWDLICAAECYAVYEDMQTRNRVSSGSALARLLEYGSTVSAGSYQEALLRRYDFRLRVRALFNEVDLLVVPVMPFPTPNSAQMEFVDDEMLSQLHRFTCPFAMSGLPTITIPSGFADNGSPIGIQLVADHCAEEVLLNAAQLIQSATRWHLARPPGHNQLQPNHPTPPGVK